MKKISIKNPVFNEGTPKICVPVIGITEEEILSEFIELNNDNIDLVELRADYFEFVFSKSKVIHLLENIRRFYKKPLLFTLRTKSEGGAADIDIKYYLELNAKVIESKLVDIVDIEFFQQSDSVFNLIDLAKKNEIATILSYHNFINTPSTDEILTKLNTMSDYGDIVKIALMPNTEGDVIKLLLASIKFKEEKKSPFVAIAMGHLGIISRISGSFFGSCIIYASYKKPSAPGQIHIKLAKEILKIMH